jgi:transcriptional regulator with XRE-family HTH domain
LATLRRQQGLSQAEPAERAGDGVSTISRLERGANARYGAIDLLATALGISRERLIKLLRRGRHNGLGERNSPSQEDHEEGK